MSARPALPGVRAARAVGRAARMRSVAIDRRLTHAAARAELRRDPILVFSMGKTGTTSLSEALALATGRPVVKAHALTRRGIDARLARSYQLGIVERPRFLWTTEAIRAAVVREDGRRWSVICGVRDPIALAVSDHFYGLQLQAAVGVQPQRRTDDLAFHRREVEALLEARFLDTDWFDDELRPITGLDVYAADFPTAAGHQVAAAGRFRALITRFEDLPSVGPVALARFLDLDAPPTIPRRNEGTGADDRSLYRRFLHTADLPGSLVDRVYDTRLARHFYTGDERDRFRARWTRARAEATP